MRRCEKCGHVTRRCVWRGKRGNIMECLTCGFSWVSIRPILDRHRDRRAVLEGQR